jgi:hypothetical protein
MKSAPLILALIVWFIASALWPYTINTWLVFFDKEPTIVFWHGLILALIPFLGQATIPAAVITWILMLFLT